MASEPMTEDQGDKIIDLLKKILKELEQINSTTRFDLKNGLEEANKTLDGIVRGIGKLK